MLDPLSDLHWLGGDHNKRNDHRRDDRMKNTPNWKHALSLTPRWREHVKQTAEGCLEWQGRIDANGYGRIGGRWAHRNIYQFEVGPIPDSHEIDHTCSNPPCVNPAHLEPVTKAEHCRRTMERLGKDETHLSAAYLRSLGMTYDDIAVTLEYAGKGSAASAVTAAIRKGLVASDDIPRVHHLSEQDQADIVALRRLGVPVGDIALWYDIDSSHASRVSRGLKSRPAA